MSRPVEEVRAWARQCADITRGRLPESEAWEQIAGRGQEWPVAYNANGKPYRGGPLMTRKMCFTNAARTVCGLTAFDPDGCRYAEGFAWAPVLGTWVHHAWVVNAYGLVIERTWRQAGLRYAGVTFDEMPRQLGYCQLADRALDSPWGPDLIEHPETADLMFGPLTS